MAAHTRCVTSPPLARPAPSTLAPVTAPAATPTPSPAHAPCLAPQESQKNALNNVYLACAHTAIIHVTRRIKLRQACATCLGGVRCDEMAAHQEKFGLQTVDLIRPLLHPHELELRSSRAALSIKEAGGDADHKSPQ